MAKGVYPMLYRNDEKFPGGESINELAQRANTAITALVLPHVWQAAKEGKTGVHIAVVSHGLCISQMISELLKMSTKQDEGDYRGLQNTAWTRLVIDIEVRTLGQMAVYKLMSHREHRKASPWSALH
jgi:broad specificity phosphatase PhoE